MHAFGFGNSDCEDESIPAQLYDIDNQGCAVRYDESSDGEEIFDDPGQKFATDDDGAARKNEDDGEDRARQVVKLLVIVFAGSARAKQAVSVTIGGDDDDSGAEMPSGWIISGKTVWEGKDTHFTSDHPVVGGILLPENYKLQCMPNQQKNVGFCRLGRERKSGSCRPARAAGEHFHP